MEWKNTPDLYTTYDSLDCASWKMVQLLKDYGWFFDDEFFYWQPKSRKGRKLLQIVKRRPLYWYPNKSTPAEKHKAMEHPKVPIDQWWRVPEKECEAKK